MQVECDAAGEWTTIMTTPQTGKVCMVAGVIEVPNSSGMGSGGSTHVIEVLKGFHQKKIDVELFCARAPGQLITEEKKNGVRIHRLFIWKNRQSAAPQQSNSTPVSARFVEPLKVIFRILRSVIHAAKIVRVLFRQNIAVVYERTSGSTMAGTLVALCKRAALICEMNDLSYSPLSLRLARLIITPNADVLPATVRHKCITMPWGVDVQHFSPRQKSEKLQSDLNITGRKVVLFTGSCLPWHGLLDLVEAAEIVAKQVPDVVFLILGDGPTRAEAVDLVIKKGIDHNFCFTGFLAYETMPQYMALADIAVAPYTSDLSGDRAKIASPLKVLEYMAMGLPAIVSDSGNHLGFIESENHGLVFETGNVKQIAAHIMNILLDQNKAVMMGKRARERCKTMYSWTAHCAVITEYVEEIRRSRSS